MEAWVDIWETHTPTLIEWGTFLGFTLAQATLEVIGKLVGVWKAITVKKEFIGPGLHLRPVCADRAWPPLQWTLTLCLAPVGMAVEG